MARDSQTDAAQFDPDQKFAGPLPSNLDEQVAAFHAAVKRAVASEAPSGRELAEATKRSPGVKAGLIAIGIRDPVGWDAAKQHFLFHWNPANPTNVTAQLCTQANTQGVIKREDYQLHRFVDRCPGPDRRAYYRLTYRPAR